MRLGTRIWGLVTIIVIAGLLAGGWFLGASPMLQEHARAETARQAAVVQNQAIEAAIARLDAEKDNLETLQARAEELETAIPRDVDSADFITTLNGLAASNAVTITSITIGEGVPYSPPSGESDDTGAPQPVTDQRITGDNFVLIPVGIEVTGGWNEVLSFVRGVQTESRLVLATKLDTVASGDTYTTKISGVMYVLERKDAPVAIGADVTADAE